MDRIDEVVKVLNANLLYVGNITDYNAFGIAEKVNRGEQILLYEKKALGLQNGISIDDSKRVIIFHLLRNLKSSTDTERGSGSSPRMIEDYELSLYLYYSNQENTVTSKELLEIAKLAFPSTLTKANKEALKLKTIEFEVTDSFFEKHEIFDSVFTKQKNNLSDNSIFVQLNYRVVMEFDRNCIPYLPCDLSRYDIELQRGVNNCTDVKDCIGIIESGSSVKYLNEQGDFVTVDSIDDIAGLIEAGSNITITGSGTIADPYVISSSASGGTWGSITGTLSNQTDLQSALDAKQNALGYTPENVANKTDMVTGSEASSIKYLSVKGIYDWATGLFATIANLALKSNIASPTFTGTVTTPAIVVSSETASRVAIIDATKNVKSADTATYPSLMEFSYVKGVTSAIQTQLDAKAPTASPTFTGIVRMAQSANIASAATVDLATATGNLVPITGTDVITSFGTVGAGAVFNIYFTASGSTLTYSANLLIPTEANIIVKAGDRAVVVSNGGGQWRFISYQRTSGQYLFKFENLANADLTIVAPTTRVSITNALTASRTLTLPAANAYAKGTSIIITDDIQGISNTFNLIVARAGADTINGTTAFTCYSTGVLMEFVSDGNSKWTGGITSTGSDGTMSTWVPSYTGHSSSPTTLYAKYYLVGKLCFCQIYVNVNGVSNSVNMTVTLPFPAKKIENIAGVRAYDNSSFVAGSGLIITVAGSNVASLYKTLAAGLWTNSGNKGFVANFFYEIE